MKKIILLFIIAVALVLAAIKNPSESEARECVKLQVIEYINDKVRDTLFNDELSGSEQLGVALAGLFAPSLIDYVLKIDVSDCIFFSTFNAKIKMKDDTKLLASGVIIYGKIILLKSDFDGINQKEE